MTGTAFVFPGQGSQSLGMMRGYESLSVIRDTFIEADDTLHTDLWKLVREGPVESLNLTIITQPLMLTAGVAVYRAWQELGGKTPAAMAGHSLGEYTALVASGALMFADALALVQFRADAMQQAVPEGSGGIAAILGLNDDTVSALCVEAQQNQIVEAVNFNSPAQVVIAGHKPAVERAMALALAKGAKRALLLPMSVPSHCSLMKTAAERLRIRLDSVTIRAPIVPIIHNVDVASHHDAASIKDALAKQLYNPVRWVETIRALIGQHRISKIVECGPGKVLAGLCKRIDSELQIFSLTDADSLRHTLALV